MHVTSLGSLGFVSSLINHKIAPSYPIFAKSYGGWKRIFGLIAFSANSQSQGPNFNLFQHFLVVLILFGAYFIWVNFVVIRFSICPTSCSCHVLLLE